MYVSARELLLLDVHLSSKKLSSRRPSYILRLRRLLSPDGYETRRHPIENIYESYQLRDQRDVLPKCDAPPAGMDLRDETGHIVTALFAKPTGLACRFESINTGRRHTLAQSWRAT